MPGPVYSERLINKEPATLSGSYVVPPARRAVVRRISVANTTTTARRVWLRAAGSYVWTALLPGPYDGQSLELRLVLYAGELLTVEMDLEGVGAHVSGFVFDDPYGSPAAGLLPQLPEPGPPPGAGAGG